ncbi:MAG TPA: TonB-dependent receptor [Longimicrobium sp.]|jgi:iron complex outermembrane receptor protein
MNPILMMCALAAAEAPRDTLPVALDTLAVSVLRVPLPLRRAPYAVSVVSGPELTRARPGLALNETLVAVPGVQVDNRFNYALGERISIRGFGARAQFGVRGVRVLVDGIPATLPDGQTTLNHVDPALLGSAEVIRGPAAALYGNASGGVIRLTTLPPPDAPLSAEGRAVAGSDGLLRTQGSAGGRSGRFWYRADASRLRYEGFRAHATAENLLGGGVLAYRRGGDEVRLTGRFVSYDALNPGSLSDSLLRVDRSQAFANNVRQRTGEEGSHAQVGATWEHAVGAGALEVAGYALTRSLDNPIPDRIIDLDRRVGGVRASLSGRTGAGIASLRWTAGAETEVQRDDRRNHANQAGERGALVLDQRERVRSRAVFGLATLSLAGRVDVLGALRRDGFLFSADDRLVAAGNPDDSGSRRLGHWSPTLGVSVSALPGVSLYANYAHAFETPTTTELANRPEGAGGFNPELDPQVTDSYEAGSKAALGTLQLQAAVYTARIRGELLGFQVPSSPDRTFFRNAGRSRRRGAEASAAVAPREGVSARAAYSYTDARFVEYTAGGTDLSGIRVPGIAPHRWEGTLNLASRRGPFAGIDARRVSSVPVRDDDREGALRSPAYSLVDVRAGWEELRVGGARVTPSAGITNLFGARYNASVVVNAFGRRFYEPGPGRAVYTGLTVSLR